MNAKAIITLIGLTAVAAIFAGSVARANITPAATEGLPAQSMRASTVETIAMGMGGGMGGGQMGPMGGGTGSGQMGPMGGAMGTGSMSGGQMGPNGGRMGSGQMGPSGPTVNGGITGGTNRRGNNQWRYGRRRNGGTSGGKP